MFTFLLKVLTKTQSRIRLFSIIPAQLGTSIYKRTIINKISVYTEMIN